MRTDDNQVNVVLTCRRADGVPSDTNLNRRSVEKLGWDLLRCLVELASRGNEERLGHLRGWHCPDVGRQLRRKADGAKEPQLRAGPLREVNRGGENVLRTRRGIEPDEYALHGGPVLPSVTI